MAAERRSKGPIPGAALRRPSRTRILAAIAVVSVVLHGAALHGAASVLDTGSVGRSAVAAPLAVHLVAREVPRASDGVQAAAPLRPAPPLRLAAAVPPTVAPAAANGSARPRTGIAGAPPDADAAADAYRFYGAQEVDVTAEPVSQWNLDPAALDALATSRIVFTLFVGRDGSVLHCSVDEPQRLSPDQRKALTARLSRTEMRPARRAGEAVPSKRRVELYTVGGT